MPKYLVCLLEYEVIRNPKARILTKSRLKNVLSLVISIWWPSRYHVYDVLLHRNTIWKNGNSVLFLQVPYLSGTTLEFRPYIFLFVCLLALLRNILLSLSNLCVTWGRFCVDSRFCVVRNKMAATVANVELSFLLISNEWLLGAWKYDWTLMSIVRCCNYKDQSSGIFFGIMLFYYALNNFLYHRTGLVLKIFDHRARLLHDLRQ